jgi:UPF0755 protein
MRKRQLFLSAMGLVVAVLVISGIVGYGLFQPVANQQSSQQDFVIPKGQSSQVIANRLQEAGLIKNGLAFRAYLKFSQKESSLQAGSFSLSPGMTLDEITQTLTTGTEDIWITIPEGWRTEEIAESLDRQELPAFDAEVFMELAAASEGKLFPDTYLVPRQATAQTLYQLLISTFEQKVSKGLATEISQSQHDLDEALVMASLVEREAIGATDMKNVAGILWHRLEIGMPLQVDATLQYAKGYDKAEQSWWSQPLAADKTIDSPFNTYQNPGLPPRPIANPGLEAIKASLDPIETNNLYYIHDSSGKGHYAPSLEVHNQNVQQYLR